MHDGQSLPTLFELSSVRGSPNLAASHADWLASVQVDRWRLKHNLASGGEVPPLLDLAGWPQCWHARRLRLPGLAESCSVIVDCPRGASLPDRLADIHDSQAKASRYPRSGRRSTAPSRRSRGTMRACGRDSTSVGRLIGSPRESLKQSFHVWRHQAALVALDHATIQRGRNARAASSRSIAGRLASASLGGVRKA